MINFQNTQLRANCYAAICNAIALISIRVSVPFVLLACLYSGIAIAQPQLSTDQAIAQMSEDIQLRLRLLTKGIGNASSVATLYTHRGELYLFETDKYRNAESDFLDALKMLKSPPPKEKEARIAWHQATGDACLYLAQAQLKLGRSSKAIDSASSALTTYSSLIADGVETAEPLYVHAVTIKFEAFTALKTLDESKRQQALEEADTAIGYLKKWSTRANGEFFANERVLLIAAKDKFAQQTK